MTEQPRRRQRQQRRLPWRYVIGVPLVVVVAVALGVGIANHNASQPQTDRLSVGATAPNGTFTTVDGQATTIAALRGHPAVVWFVTTFCDSCQAGTQVMAQQINQFTHHHVKVVELELPRQPRRRRLRPHHLWATSGRQAIHQPKLDLGDRLATAYNELRPQVVPRRLLPTRRQRPHRLHQLRS